MKKNILLLLSMFLFVACETGIPYDKNSTKKSITFNESTNKINHQSIEQSIEDLLDDKMDEEEIFNEDSEPIILAKKGSSYIEEGSKTTSNNGLDVKQIREGIHNTYLRLVFDVYEFSKPASKVGVYEAKYNANKKYIEVILYGYKNFSAPLPSFPLSSEIEQIHFEQYPINKGFKFYIQLRQQAKVKVFDLKNPARLVFDIKAI